MENFLLIELNILFLVEVIYFKSLILYAHVGAPLVNIDYLLGFFFMFSKI